MINPTYTNKQYWLTALLSGVMLGLILSIVYIIMYDRLYVKSSFLFSILYLIPFVWLSLALAFFKWKFVYSEFTFKQAFFLSICAGIIGSIFFSSVIFIALSYFGIESRAAIYDNGERLLELFSPEAISLSFIVINVALTLLYSLIIAFFAQKK